MRNFIIIYRWVILFLAMQLNANTLARSIPAIRVYVFLNTECPISQQYVHRINTLQKKFEFLGVQFTAYFPLSTDNRAAIERFRNEYRLISAGKPDVHAQLAHKFGVRVTPEVVVLNATNRVVYQGAIDDWYISPGRHQREARQAFLENALDALLANRPILPSQTDAVGCLIE